MAKSQSEPSKVSKKNKEEDRSPLPKKIGPYNIESILEQGGMNTLYLGTAPGTEDPLVIKLLRSRYKNNKHVTERFFTEAQILEQANHPNIVGLHGQGEWQGLPYIALEYIQGVSLRQYLKRNSMSLRQAIETILEVSYAVCHLHSLKILHRDLKPENILLTEEGKVKVIDLGIAQYKQDNTEQVKASQPQIIGTPIYMSPEQRENPQTVSYTTDIYSLALITYELVLGKESHGVIHLSIMPKGLLSTLRKALQQDPLSRQQSMSEYIASLTTYLHSPQFKKDLHGRDYAAELLSACRSMQELLNPEMPEEWHYLKTSSSHYHPNQPSGIYYDFIRWNNGHSLIVLAEPQRTDSLHLFHSCQIRGTLQALAYEPLSPKELASSLNMLICANQQLPKVRLSCVYLNPNDNELLYLSCGDTPLLYLASNAHQSQVISCPNPLLKADQNTEFRTLQHAWYVGDSLILSSGHRFLRKLNPIFQSEVEELILKHYHHSPTTQTKALLRQWKTLDQQRLKNKPVVFLSVKRTE